jgi:hypothetical protein
MSAHAAYVCARCVAADNLCLRCVAADNFKDFDHARHENIFLTQGRIAVSPRTKPSTVP